MSRDATGLANDNHGAEQKISKRTVKWPSGNGTYQKTTIKPLYKRLAGTQRGSGSYQGFKPLSNINNSITLTHITIYISVTYFVHETNEIAVA